MSVILQLSTSCGPGGAEKMVATLSNELKKGKFRVIVGLFRPGWLKSRCEEQGIDVHVLLPQGMCHWRWFYRCWGLVRKEQVALIHAHEFSAIVYGAIISFITGVPLVATLHGKHYFWEKLRRRLAYRLISSRGSMVTVSNDLKQFVVTTIGIPSSRIGVIYNGTPDIPEMSPEELGQYRLELSIPADAKVIGSVGSLYGVKGHRYLLRAMTDVLRKVPHAMLLVIGRGQLEGALKEEARILGIDRSVRFLGLRDDIPKLLAVMQVFAMPSLSEGLSIALLEAMAAGKPVVATRVGGNGELLEDGVSGLLIPAGDSDKLARALVSLLEDHQAAEQLGRNARRRVSEHFSLRRMVSEYRELYAAMLKDTKTHVMPNVESV